VRELLFSSPHEIGSKCGLFGGRKESELWEVEFGSGAAAAAAAEGPPYRGVLHFATLPPGVGFPPNGVFRKRHTGGHRPAAVIPFAKYRPGLSSPGLSSPGLSSVVRPARPGRRSSVVGRRSSVVGPPVRRSAGPPGRQVVGRLSSGPAVGIAGRPSWPAISGRPVG
jgi:hypothetical protein